MAIGPQYMSSSPADPTSNVPAATGLNILQGMGPWGAVAGGLLGMLGGGAGTPSTQTTESSADVTLKNFADLSKGQSELEKQAYQNQLSQLGQLQSLVGAGPGQTDVTAGLTAQQDFASRISQLLGMGGTDVAAGQAFAQQIFAPQQVAMQQAFQDQQVQANRLASRMGRAGYDPILRNKLAQEQTRQQAQLQAQQGAFAAQQSREIPQMQLQMAEQLANVRGGLASQAMQNRMAMLNLGQQLTQSERQYRLDTARRTQMQSQSGSSGGGLGGAIGGLLGGIGGGAGAISKIF